MFTGFLRHLQRFTPILLLAMNSCQTAPAPPPLPEMTFTRYQPIHLDVGSMDIIEEYKSPGHEPNIEHLVAVSPAEAMRIWVKDRLRASGSDKSLQIIIKDASIVSHKPENSNIALGPAPNRRYDARLEVELRIYGTDAMSEASVNVISTQTITLSDSASLDERKRVFYRMVYDLMESANAELEKQIFTYFTRYILYAQTP